jgi:hypothetical protein
MSQEHSHAGSPDLRDGIVLADLASLRAELTMEHEE